MRRCRSEVDIKLTQPQVSTQDEHQLGSTSLLTCCRYDSAAIFLVTSGPSRTFDLPITRGTSRDLGKSYDASAINARTFGCRGSCMCSMLLRPWRICTLGHDNGLAGLATLGNLLLDLAAVLLCEFDFVNMSWSLVMVMVIKRHGTLSLPHVMLRRGRVSAPQPQTAAAAYSGA